MLITFGLNFVVWDFKNFEHLGLRDPFSYIKTRITSIIDFNVELNDSLILCH